MTHFFPFEKQHPHRTYPVRRKYIFLIFLKGRNMSYMRDLIQYFNMPVHDMALS